MCHFSRQPVRRLPERSGRGRRDQGRRLPRRRGADPQADRRADRERRARERRAVRRAHPPEQQGPPAHGRAHPRGAAREGHAAAAGRADRGCRLTAAPLRCRTAQAARSTASAQRDSATLWWRAQSRPTVCGRPQTRPALSIHAGHVVPIRSGRSATRDASARSLAVTARPSPSG